MAKLNVNHEACIGCGACVAIDPEHFDFNDDGLSEVISNNNLESEEAKNAVSSCPTNAISFIDESEEKCNCGCEDCECDSNPDGKCNCGCDNCGHKENEDK